MSVFDTIIQITELSSHAASQIKLDSQYKQVRHLAQL